MKLNVCIIGLSLSFLMGCSGTGKKNPAGNGHPVAGPPKIQGVAKAKVDKMLVSMYRRGIQHGRSIAIANMLVSTRNFDVVWETALQDLPKLPSLVPYLLGFLDSVNSQKPSKALEDRRAAKHYAPKLPLPQKQASNQIRDRCVLVLARMIPLAEDPELRNRLIPEKLKDQLREAMKREIKYANSDRLKNVLKVSNFVKAPENVDEVLKVFQKSILKEDWAVASATMSALKGSRDAGVRKAFLDAFKTLYAKPDQPESALCGSLLRNAADMSVDSSLLNLASSAAASGQPFDVRNAGIYSLGCFDRNKKYREKALSQLVTVLNKAGNRSLRITAVKAIARYKKGVAKLRVCESVIRDQRRPEDGDLLKAITTAIKDAS
jgi:hypothetical protein